MHIHVALNKLVAQGKLKRLSKGKYYKPEETVFGVLPPDTNEIVKDFLLKDGKIIGYITGTNAFARIGLTTQISSTIYIGTNKYRRPLLRGTNRIEFILQPNVIQEDDISLYIILDAIRFIRSIPATTPNEAVEILLSTIKGLKKQEQHRLAELSLAYTPYVRALLGAMYEQLSLPYQQLRQSLNGTTNYKLSISEEVLPTKTNWRIL